jgi:UDP-N-acetylmuramoyl-tripeptide--D-alanyl-D-alanine ligase
MRQLVQNLLQSKVKKLIAKHKPRIVAVTGSVGKTSTKNAIATVLGGKFHVRASTENYNNEFGVPLAILGLKSPGRSALGWLKVLMHKEADFPQVLVLEFGVDRPGDMKALMDVAPPEVGVVTAVSPVHAEYFGTIEKLAEEKAALVVGLPASGLAVLNADDDRVAAFAAKSPSPVVTYGFRPADVQATEYQLGTREDFSFEPGEEFATTKFHVRTKNGEGDFALKNAIGKQQVSAALAAIAVGEHFGLTHDEMNARLAAYQAPPGRLRPIPGIKGTLILDDSYNAAPASTAAALAALSEFAPAEGRRRIAVLGDMAELGQYSETEHRNIGLQAAGAGVDLLICVGEKSRDMCRGADEAGMASEQVMSFPNSEEAGRWLDRSIRQGDIVLVKGSQSMRMEKVVKEIMAEPLRAPELLVRQYGKWLES